MRCTPAPACTAVRSQATALWPKRSQASDGICASPKHTLGNPGSDHEPHVIIKGVGYATAVDLTDDKANGCDADAWAEHLRITRDSRVKYVICNKRMFSSYSTSTRKAWEWGPYNGSNPHEKHTHLSVLPHAILDTRPWFPQEDDMTPQQDARLTAVEKSIREIHAALFDGVPSHGVPAIRTAVTETAYHVQGYDLPGKPSLLKQILAKIK